MKGFGRDEALGFKDDTQGLEDKKKNINNFWMAPFMHCFSSAMTSLAPCEPEIEKVSGTNEENTEKNPASADPQQSDAYNHEEWEVPFDAITDLVYIASGAEGFVYGGSLYGDMVAVKKLRNKYETDIEHLKKLKHENIVRFRGVCTQPDNYCVIMEYCQYGPLYNFLHNNGRLTPVQILKWARDIAKGMSYLHANKIIHRDLKSPNILIGDNLVAKVSDFGISCEWNKSSAVMSLKGTVAWMAPEVIRHEKCSERVDIWSYGVLLWELLTQEVPYKTMEQSAIMFGVGMGTLSLPVPTTCPEGLQLLMNQCWNRVPNNRPSFKIIMAHLDIAGDELTSIDSRNFKAIQESWQAEVQTRLDSLTTMETNFPGEVSSQCREVLKHARDFKQLYETQWRRVNEFYMEVCAKSLKLEQRETAVAEREKAIIKACRCSCRRPLKYKRQSSSSSDGDAVAVYVLKDVERKEVPQLQAVVSLVDETSNETVHNTIDGDVRKETQCSNNNVANVAKIDTIIEKNGNMATLNAEENTVNHNQTPMPDIAQV